MPDEDPQPHNPADNFKLPWKMAMQHAASLPTFTDAKSARRVLFALRDEHLSRLKSIFKGKDLPHADGTREGVSTIESWLSECTDAQLAEMGTSIEEIEFLMDWYIADLAVKLAPEATWVIRKNFMITDRWEIGLNHGLATWILPAVFSPRPPTPSRRRKKRITWMTENLKARTERGNDPTLHPTVLANRNRLSKDKNLRHCQIGPLIRGVDVFDNTALARALNSPEWARDPLEILRCFEHFGALSDETIETLLAYVRTNRRYGRQFALGQIIRHRPSIGLDLAAEFPEVIERYCTWPIVKAVAPVDDSRAVLILARVVELISQTKQCLSQEGDEFVAVLCALYRWVKRGNADAIKAMKVVARRWRRIPPETMQQLKRKIPALAEGIVFEDPPTKTRRRKA